MKIRQIPLILMFVMVAAPTLAQFEPAEKSSYELSIYGWLASTYGGAGFGETTGNIDSGGILSFDESDLGGSVFLRAKRAKVGWILGVEYLDGTNGESDLVFETQTLIVEADLTFEVWEGLDLLFGARFVDADPALIFLSGPGPAMTTSGSDSWVDPILGMDFTKEMSSRWRFFLRADVGGFGLVSDITWQLAPGFSYQANDRTRIEFGYRALSIEYETGAGADFFLYDVEQNGAFVGVTLGFGGGARDWM